MLRDACEVSAFVTTRIRPQHPNTRRAPLTWAGGAAEQAVAVLDGEVNASLPSAR